jgi:HD-like signal output (HDOD) protein
MDDQRTNLKHFTKDLRSLPTLPGIISKLSSLADNDKASVQEMARVVSADQVLSAKVLRLVNSPFYGFPGRVSTVSNALILLGVNVVKGLVLSSSIFDIMERNVVGLWEHSLGSGVAANLIAKRLGLQEPEEISTAALLHDLGRVIIKLHLKDDYASLQSRVTDGGLSMVDAERERLHADHAEVGEWLATTWLLPEKLVEPITCHHEVERSVAHRSKTAVVHLADVLIKASGFGFSGDDFVPRIQPAAWKALALTESLIAELIDEVEERLVEVKNFSLEIQSVDGDDT